MLLLGWTVDVAKENGLGPGRGFAAALARGAETLRWLTQPDGRLPRFHGGNGSAGLADLAMATAAHRPGRALPEIAMGFARLRHGRTGLVVDAARPPASSPAAHAATLALELTVGRRPVIVNCGPGDRFGPRWARASRTTAAHSTLSLDGFSSSRFGRDQHRLSELPSSVRLDREETETGTRLAAAHDGYVPTHGLWHERRVELSRDGRRLAGEDALLSLTASERRRFDRFHRRSGAPRFAVRFHLHPDVEPSLDMGGHAISLLLPSGALWVFRAKAARVRLALEASLTFGPASLQPIDSRQIVLFSSAGEYATRVRWELAAVSMPGSPTRDTDRLEGAS